MNFKNFISKLTFLTVLVACSTLYSQAETSNLTYRELMREKIGIIAALAEKRVNGYCMASRILEMIPVKTNDSYLAKARSHLLEISKETPKKVILEKLDKAQRSLSLASIFIWDAEDKQDIKQLSSIINMLLNYIPTSDNAKCPTLEEITKELELNSNSLTGFNRWPVIGSTIIGFSLLILLKHMAQYRAA